MVGLQVDADPMRVLSVLQKEPGVGKGLFARCAYVTRRFISTCNQAENNKDLYLCFSLKPL